MADNREQGRNGSIWSKYRQKKRGGRDGGKSKPNKKTIFSTVRCDKHGSLNSTTKLVELNVSVPRTRREKYLLGCPLCAKEALQNKNT